MLKSTLTLLTLAALSLSAIADNFDNMVAQAARQGHRYSAKEIATFRALRMHYDARDGAWYSENTPDDPAYRKAMDKPAPYWQYLNYEKNKWVIDGNGEYHLVHFVGFRYHTLPKTPGYVKQYVSEFQTVDGTWHRFE
jgi:hypothetical protein